MSPPLKLGILGGTFDPIHLGHLRTAEEIAQALELDRVYLIPSASPPHKTGTPVTPFLHRLAMARMAVEKVPLLRVHDLEGKRAGLSYSIETLRLFREMFRPEPDIYFILGMDAFMEIHTWKDYRRLFDYAHFVIIQRGGFDVGSLESYLKSLGLKLKALPESRGFCVQSGKSVSLRQTTRMDISSTQIRHLVGLGRSIRFLVTEPVRTYISNKGIYR